MNSGELDILLVEDNQDDMDLALHALKREKLANHIFVARDGEEALDFLFCRGTFAYRSFEDPPKLVLLDLKLPKVDGMEVLKQVKRDLRTKNIPIVIMTSSKEERDLVSGYNLGANSLSRSRSTSTSSARQSRASDCTGWSSISRPPSVAIASWRRSGLDSRSDTESGRTALGRAGARPERGRSEPKVKISRSTDRPPSDKPILDHRLREPATVQPAVHCEGRSGISRSLRRCKSLVAVLKRQ